jgi:DNA-binding transcriptional ArsR family regulator
MSRPRNSESVFRAIADPTRRKMLDLLRDGEQSVGELITTMRLQRPVASHHLGTLIQAGLVRQRRRGRGLVCVIDSRPLHQAQAWLNAHLHR